VSADAAKSVLFASNGNLFKKFRLRNRPNISLHAEGSTSRRANHVGNLCLEQGLRRSMLSGRTLRSSSDSVCQGHEILGSSSARAVIRLSVSTSGLWRSGTCCYIRRLIAVGNELPEGVESGRRLGGR